MGLKRRDFFYQIILVFLRGTEEEQGHEAQDEKGLDQTKQKTKGDGVTARQWAEGGEACTVRTREEPTRDVLPPSFPRGLGSFPGIFQAGSYSFLFFVSLKFGSVSSVWTFCITPPPTHLPTQCPLNLGFIPFNNVSHRECILVCVFLFLGPEISCSQRIHSF